MAPRVHVVVNLDSERVTWARTFLAAARAADVEYSDVARPDRLNLYIGDELPQRRPGATVYLLAAFSAAPGESDDIERRRLELANIRAAELTVTLSNAETLRVRDFEPSARLYTGGFPVGPVVSGGSRKSRAVCFIGDDRPVKDLEFELRLIPELSALGYRTIHLSPRPLPRRAQLQALGCEVYECLEREQYWARVAEATHYCATSRYESLCVAGIEAATLGCACAAPDVGGFRDWCPERYAPGDLRSAISRIEAARPFSVDLAPYQPQRFFAGVAGALA